MISAIPDADGIVGDLGGGSLELVEVAGGKVGARASLPLGVLRLDALAAEGEGTFAKKVAKARRGRRLRGRGGGTALLSGRRQLAHAGPARHGADRPSAADHPSARDGRRPAARAAGRAGASSTRPSSATSPPSRCRASRPCPTPTLLLDALVEGARAGPADRLQLRHPRRPALRRADAADSARSIR